MNKKRKDIKKEMLQYLITSFAIRVAPKLTSVTWNPAWRVLWKGIAKLKLFKEKK